MDKWVPYKPDEAANLTAILAACTSDNARLMGMENETGRILEGFSAVFVELDQNLLIRAPESIHLTGVVNTYSRGKNFLVNKGRSVSRLLLDTDVKNELKDLKSTLLEVN